MQRSDFLEAVWIEGDLAGRLDRPLTATRRDDWEEAGRRMPTPERPHRAHAALARRFHRVRRFVAAVAREFGVGWTCAHRPSSTTTPR